MDRTEKIVISTTTFITSLLCYSYAKAADKEAAPYTMFGAFLGTLIGEVLAERISSGTTYKSITKI